MRKELDFRLDLVAVAERITSRTKMICLDSPSNPVGRVYTEEELKGVVELAKDRDLYILYDTANERLVWDGRRRKT